MKDIARFRLVLLCLIIASLLIVSVRADTYYKQGENISLKIPCTIDDNVCSNAARCNMTIVNSLNGSYAINYKPMTNLHNGDFQYNTTFNDYGNYLIKISCWDSGTNATAVYQARVTQSGVEGKTSEGILYLVGIGIMMLFIVMCIIGLCTIKGTNKMDLYGDMKINYGKYFRMGLILLMTILIWITMFFIREISYTFLTFPMLTNILTTLFRILGLCVGAVFIIAMAYCWIAWAGDLKLEKTIRRNLPPR